VVAPVIVGGDGEGRALAGADDLEARRQLRHAVAMAHPDLLAVARAPQPVEQRAGAGDLDEGAAELAVGRGLDLAAELGAQGLLAVADAEQRDAEGEDDLRRARRAGVEHGGRATRQDDRAWAEVAD